MTRFDHTYKDIISVENLLRSWQEFLKGKKNRKDVAEFSVRLMDNILDLHNSLKNKMYEHGGYTAFNISDPKPRNIHKASVRDRLLHHAIYRILYPYFDKKFIFDSYSCRNRKGTHKAINRFQDFNRKVSKNNTKQCWILKCDIRKFFASIDHDILKSILAKYLEDKDTLALLATVIDSFQTNPNHIYAMAYIKEAGLPLGNLTSQLLVNIYMNEFDQFVKHKLKVKYYIRYADDFVIFSQYKKELIDLLRPINAFLKKELRLDLHPNKVFIRTLASGVDFLGWVNFPHHRVLRTATKRKMMKRIKDNMNRETLQSYLGILSHGNGYKLKKKVLEFID